jgi:hypothetical protein
VVRTSPPASVSNKTSQKRTEESSIKGWRSCRINTATARPIFLGFSSACNVLDPLRKEDGSFYSPKLGLLIGVEGNFSVGANRFHGGSDVIVDLYHQQVAVATYQGDGYEVGSGVEVGGS